MGEKTTTGKLVLQWFHEYFQQVTEEYQLNTAKRLQLSEKGWVKMATHFTVLLSDRDTDLLTKIQVCSIVPKMHDLFFFFFLMSEKKKKEKKKIK